MSDPNDTQNQPVTFIRSTPDPREIALVAGVIRTILAGLAGMGVLGGTWAALSDVQLSAISAMLLTLASLAGWAGVGVWSWIQKVRQARLDHAGSVASANSGQAVQAMPASTKET